MARRQWSRPILTATVALTLLAGGFGAAAPPASAATTATTPVAPSITIVENTMPDRPQDFTFTGCLGSGCSDFVLDDDADPTHPNSVRAEGLAPGSYVVTQAGNAAWPLTSLVCPGEIISLANRRATITLTAGENRTCTFTNKTQSLTVVQDTDADGPHDFSYSGCSTAGCGDFSLDDDADATLPNTASTTALAPGTYTVTQHADATWPLTALSCPGETVSVANRRATVTLTAGENITCTFTNQTQSLTVIEDSDPDDPHDFAFTGCLGAGCSPFTLDDDGDATRANTAGATELAPGTYRITQSPDDMWPLATLSCPGETVDLANRQATVTLTAGENRTCTFTNRTQSITVIEDETPNAGLDIAFTRCHGSDCTDFALDDDGDTTLPSTTTAAALVPGTYVVTQPADGAPELTGIDCDTGETVDLAGRRVTIDLTTSEHVTCTFRHRPTLVPLAGVTQVSAGTYHTCAVLASAEARCWGASHDTQEGPNGDLGDGTFEDSDVPVTVGNPEGTGPLAGVAEISAGWHATCARLQSGQARCWGLNDRGQLGDGTTTTSARPVVVSNPEGTGPLTGVTQIATGWGDACALLADAHVVCWGSPDVLGSPRTTFSARPVAVSNPEGTGPLSDVAEIAVGVSDACALLHNGEARCWGINLTGELGVGTAGRVGARPVVVSNVDGTGPLTGIARLAVGWYTTCAALQSGEARCWGNNWYGNLGDGTTTNRSRPVVVSSVDGPGALTDVERVVVGITQGCAVLTNGEVRCWGQRVAIGNGTTGDPQLTPIVTLNGTGDGPLTDVVGMSASNATCALRTDGHVQCWGDNFEGQLGDGTRTDRLLPTTVVEPATTP